MCTATTQMRSNRGDIGGGSSASLPRSAWASGWASAARARTPPRPRRLCPRYGCYWERDRNDSGDFDAIIANDNVDGPSSVSVNKGEFVKFSGSCTWTLSK